MNRRNFLMTASLAASSSLLAIDPVKRINPRIKGLSLAAYSMRSEMKWMKGKQQKGSMEILDFIEYAAKEQFDGVELTDYFFQEPVASSYINQVKRNNQVIGLDIIGGAIGLGSLIAGVFEGGEGPSKAPQQPAGMPAMQTAYDSAPIVDSSDYHQL